MSMSMMTVCSTSHECLKCHTTTAWAPTIFGCPKAAVQGNF